MELKAVDFEFKKGIVSWSLAGPNAPIYHGIAEKLDGKPFKWLVRASYENYEATWNTFSSPTPTQAKRYLKSLKKQIKKSN